MFICKPAIQLNSSALCWFRIQAWASPTWNKVNPSFTFGQVVPFEFRFGLVKVAPFSPYHNLVFWKKAIVILFLPFEKLHFFAAMD